MYKTNFWRSSNHTVQINGDSTLIWNQVTLDISVPTIWTANIWMQICHLFGRIELYKVVLYFWTMPNHTNGCLDTLYLDHLNIRYLTVYLDDSGMYILMVQIYSNWPSKWMVLLTVQLYGHWRSNCTAVQWSTYVKLIWTLQQSCRMMGTWEHDSPLTLPPLIIVPKPNCSFCVQTLPIGV